MLKVTPKLDLDGSAVGDAIKSGDSPLEQAIGRENMERYETAFSRLKPDEREAIVGTIEMGPAYPELAEALGKLTADGVQGDGTRSFDSPRRCTGAANE